ncbi:hypothetical protein CLAIMM_08640 [Cladophialophora immunda]|nr:hypothetical protein CLAIMM_08640 [Cladophialophora immunda]
MAPSKGAGAPSPARTTAGASEADIATNKALLFHAEAARLAKSWLRGATTGGDGRDEDEDEQDKAEAALEKEFLRNRDLYSETGGVGYHPPTTGSASSTSAPGVNDATTMFLRKQLLRGRTTNGNAHAHNATTTRPRTQPQASRREKSGGDSDEEESRSGVGKSKRQAKNIRVAAGSETAKPAPQIEEEETGDAFEKSGANSALDQSRGESDSVVQAPEPDIPHVAPPKTSKKRGAASYLDELLASRAAKKQKKKNKKSKSLVESAPG